MKRVFIRSVVTVILVLCVGGCRKDTKPIVIGETVEITTETIGPEGGTITVSKPGDPLDGLIIEVPEGAYDETLTFDISYKPIISHNLESGFETVTPLIEIDNGGIFAKEIVTVTVPADIPDGFLGMPFMYDEGTGELEPLLVLSQSATSVTYGTQHFSGSVTTKVDIKTLNGQSIDTKFVPGEDTWQIENEGSYITPSGNCSGMSLGAMWYYVEKKKKGEAQLWNRHESYSLPAGTTTPGFLLDDDLPIKLCSVIQKDLKPFIRIPDIMSKYTWGEEDISRDSYHFYATVAALKQMKEPVYLSVRSTQINGGHALICYKVDNYTLYVADPNKPADYLRAIIFIPGDTLKDGKFKPYSSVQNVLDVLEGTAEINYEEIVLAGKTCLTNKVEISKRWTDMESGSIGAGIGYFPEYTLRVSELDAQGDVTQQYGLDVLNEVQAGHPDIEVTLVAPFEGKLTIYDFNNGKPKPFESNRVTLKDGSNLLGFHVQGKASWQTGTGEAKTGLRWAGFDWITITFKEGEKPSVDLTTFNYGSFELNKMYVHRKDFTGEEWDQYLSPNFCTSGSGSFSGSTFASTWDCSGANQYTTNVSLTLNPSTLAITAFQITQQVVGTYTEIAVIKSKPGIALEYTRDESDRLSYWVGGVEVCDYIDPETFEYRTEESSGLVSSAVIGAACDENTEFSIEFSVK